MASGLNQIAANLFTLKYEKIPHKNIFIVGLLLIFFLIPLFGFEWLLLESLLVWSKEEAETVVENLDRNNKFQL